MLNRKKGVAKVPPFKLHFTAKKNRGTVQLLMNQLRFKRTFFMFLYIEIFGRDLAQREKFFFLDFS